VSRFAYGRFALVLCLAFAAACSGQAGGSSPGTGGSSVGGSGLTGIGGLGGSVTPPPPGPGPQAIAACTPAMQTQVGPTPLRRISTLEYRNAVRDLFDDTTDVTAASGFPSDEQVGSFVANVKTVLSPTNNEGYMTAAEGVASRFAAKFATESGCAASDAALRSSLTRANAGRSPSILRYGFSCAIPSSASAP